MKRITGLLMIVTLFFASCDTKDSSENAATITPNITTTDNDMKVGSSFSEGKEEIDFRPIDVYIFIDGDEKSPIGNAKITAKCEGQEDQSFKTNKEGIASFKFKLGSISNFNIEAEKYLPLKQDVTIKEKLKFGLKPRA